MVSLGRSQPTFPTLTLPEPPLPLTHTPSFSHPSHIHTQHTLTSVPWLPQSPCLEWLYPFLCPRACSSMSHTVFHSGHSKHWLNWVELNLTTFSFSHQHLTETNSPILGCQPESQLLKLGVASSPSGTIFVAWPLCLLPLK